MLAGTSLKSFPDTSSKKTTRESAAPVDVRRILFDKDPIWKKKSYCFLFMAA